MKSNYATYKIYIIESLDMSVKLNGLFKYGEFLRQEINSSIQKSKYPKNLSCEYYDIQSQYKWQKIWKNICNDCKSGLIPIIHIIAHGQHEGLVVAGYKLLKWQYVIQQFRKVNNLCNKQLIVTMNVCYGMHCLTNLLSLKEMPFKYLLSSFDKLPLNVFNLGKSMQHPFVIYYKTMIETANMERAIKLFSKSLPRQKHKDYSSWCLLDEDKTMPFNFSLKIIK